MATILRLAFASAVTIAVAVIGIVYYRVFPPLRDMATGEMSGPFTQAVTTADTLVPITLAIVLLGVWVWALAGGVQEERSKVRGP
jgi:hypothetical protein